MKEEEEGRVIGKVKREVCGWGGVHGRRGKWRGGMVSRGTGNIYILVGKYNTTQSILPCYRWSDRPPFIQNFINIQFYN